MIAVIDFHELKRSRGREGGREGSFYEGGALEIIGLLRYGLPIAKFMRGFRVGYCIYACMYVCSNRTCMHVCVYRYRIYCLSCPWLTPFGAFVNNIRHKVGPRTFT